MLFTPSSPNFDALAKPLPLSLLDGTAVVLPPLPDPRLLREDGGIPLPKRLWRCAETWRRILPLVVSDDKTAWMLRGLRHGFPLPTPSDNLAFARPNKPATRKFEAFIDAELHKYVQLGIVRRCSRQFCRGVMALDAVPQASGPRLVLDGSPLNNLVSEPEPFKYEDLSHAAGQIQSQDWMAKADVKRLYLNIPIHRKLQRWVCCEWRGSFYTFAALPLGLSHAPRLATLVMRPLISLLRRVGLRVTQYLDDGLVLSRSREESVVEFNLYCQLLARAGLLVHPTKCSTEPTKCIEFLGFEIDTDDMTVGLTARKRAAYVQQARALMADAGRQRPVPIKKVSRFVGSIVSTMRAFRPSLALLTHTNKVVAEAAYKQGWRASILLDDTVREECRAVRRLLASGLWDRQRLSSPEAADVVLTTDASASMWGAYLSLPTTPDKPISPTHQAQWPSRTLDGPPIPTATALVQHAERLIPSLDAQWARHTAAILDRLCSHRGSKHPHGSELAERVGRSHNNLLELLAILLAMARFAADLHKKRTWIRSDNMAALAAVRRAHSSASSALDEMGLKTALFSELLDTKIVATTHLPGAQNDEADKASRQWLDHHKQLEWPIDQRWLSRLCDKWHTKMPDIDAFATAANTKCPQFWSLHPDPLAAGTDAMVQNWTGRRLLLNPPFSMFDKVIAKMRKEPPEEALVIAPRWPNRSWHRRLTLWATHQEETPTDAIRLGPNFTPALFNPKWRIWAYRVTASSIDTR